MQIQRIRLQHFRNVHFEDVSLQGKRTFLVGNNGQGKSNLLEALGFMTTLRSFRTHSLSPLLKKGEKEFTLFYEIDHDIEGSTELKIQSVGNTRRVEVNGEPVERMSALINRFPSVTMSSGDLMLLRGGPAERRRFLDVTLSIADSSYFDALRSYHRCLNGRNRLLKRNAGAAELNAFEEELAISGVAVATLRAHHGEQLQQQLINNYARFADGSEIPDLRLCGMGAESTIDSYRSMLEEQRERDRLLGATQKGPHRDDFAVSIETGRAKEFASDGQQRALCLALRMAQLEFIHKRLGIMPVLLADDVLGELDRDRRLRFWENCPSDLQVVATGTELPEDVNDWQIYTIENGALSR